MISKLYTIISIINYEMHPFILDIVLTDGSLQVSKTLQGLVNARDFEQSKHYTNYSFSYLLTFVSV